jgi:hypothetical protein
VAAYDVSVHDTVRNNSRVVLFQEQIEVQCGGHSADDPDQSGKLFLHSPCCYEHLDSVYVCALHGRYRSYGC